MGKTWKGALVAGAMLSAFLVAPSAAWANTAGTTATVRFPDKSFTVNGKVVARIRNGFVIWSKKAGKPYYTATVKAQLIDTGPGDGYCARMSIHLLGDPDSPTAKECNGVWTTRTISSYESEFVVIQLYTNKNGAWPLSWKVNKPAGW